jgi:serine phosphatase RsbU (regulator of sigma subunit)/Tfp pilus assembly protein PilF
MDRLSVILFLLIPLCVNTVQAQHSTLDSLQSQLHAAGEIEKISIFIELMKVTQQDSPHDALVYADEAEKLLLQHPDRILESQLLTRTGWVYYYLNDYDTAMDFARQSEQVAFDITNPEQIAGSKLLRGRLLRQQDRYELALAALDSALILTDLTDAPLLKAAILNEAGTVYRRKGESARALEYHERALELLGPTGDTPSLSSTYNFIGIMHDIIGNYDQSLKFHLQSLASRELLNDRRGMAASMTNIGTLHQRIGQYPEALAFYEQSLPIWRELQANDPLASTLNNIGAVYELMGQYDQARDFYEEAYEYWKESGNLYSISISLENLGAIYMYLGDVDRALEFKRQSLKNHEQLGNTRGISNTLNSIASIYLKMNHPDLALSAAHQSLLTAHETKSWSLIRNAHEILSEIYESTGNYEQALEHHKLYKAADDTLFNSDSQSVIAEMQEQYRTRQQQQQIELLQQERELQNLWFVILSGGFLLALVVPGFLYNRYKLKVRVREQLHHAEMQKARLYADSVEARTKLLHAENERKSMELEDARRLQLSMLPEVLPQSRYATVAAYMETAAEVGGDYYDAARSDDDSLTLCIGDATGHGTRAGLLVTAVKSLFNLMSDEKDLKLIMQRCSSAIKKMNLPRLYMAFAMVRLRDHTLELVGAGMPPALIYRSKTGKVERIDLKGMPLGSVPDYPYVKHTVSLENYDVLLLMTDGFPELSNGDGKMLGYEFAEGLLASSGTLSPESIIKRFRETSQEWIKTGRPNDDMTFVVLRKNPVKILSVTDHNSPGGELSEEKLVSDSGSL